MRREREKYIMFEQGLISISLFGKQLNILKLDNKACLYLWQNCLDQLSRFQDIKGLDFCRTNFSSLAGSGSLTNKYLNIKFIKFVKLYFKNVLRITLQ